MHASVEELLSLRDGEPGSDAAAAHVAACARCRAELDQLRDVRIALAALPLQEPAASAWTTITGRAARPAPPRTRMMIASAFAAAAGLALVGLLLARMEEPEATRAPAVAATTAPAATAPAGAAPASASTAPASADALGTEALIARSRRLEAALERMRFEPQVVKAGTAVTIETLEEHIAFVDYRLSLEAEDPLAPEQSHRLWQQRVDLMGSLVKVRYAQLQQVSY